MTDTERLDLIEHYKWKLYLLDVWAVEGVFGHAHGKNIREAIDNALAAQQKWSIG